MIVKNTSLTIISITCKNEHYNNNEVKLFPKTPCSCGKTVYKYYLEKQLETKYRNKSEIEAV